MTRRRFARWDHGDPRCPKTRDSWARALQFHHCLFGGDSSEDTYTLILERRGTLLRIGARRALAIESGRDETSPMRGGR